MDFRFELDQTARIELFATRDWIAERSPAGADKWFRGLLARIETLKRFPRRCPIAREARKYGDEVRVLTYGKKTGNVHRILFVIEGDLIRVLSIRNASRGIEPL